MEFARMFGTGPTVALIRYGVTAIGSALVARGYVDSDTAQTVIGGVMTVVPAIVGAVLSTKQQQIKTVAALPVVKGVQLTNGETVR